MGRGSFYPELRKVTSRDVEIGLVDFECFLQMFGLLQYTEGNSMVYIYSERGLESCLGQGPPGEASSFSTVKDDQKFLNQHLFCH